MTLTKIIRNGNSQASVYRRRCGRRIKSFTLSKWAMRILPGPLMIRGYQPGR